jgi:pimeloyl-ACP methyl ester carboxylesterase
MATTPTIVLIPGLTCDATFWAHQREALSALGTVVVPRLHDLDSIVAMAETVLIRTSGPLDLVGHSMGGRVAFEVVRLAPERVRSLAVLDTGVHPADDAEIASRQVRLDLADEGGMEALAADWVPAMVHPDRRRDPGLIQAITEMVTSYSVAQYRGQINALLRRPDAREMLASIRVPTLVACGRADEWSPLEQHRQIAGAIPGAGLEVIERAGHMVAMEQPESTTEILTGWLGGVIGHPS